MEEKKEQFEEIEIKKEVKEVRTDSYFDGKILELIGWKLLSYLITCVSAGIAYPWGKCMVYRYQFSHTIYNGKRLKFEGNGGDLFVNRFKWIFFTIITLGIYGWWVPAKKANWVISNLHFEDEEFKKEESFFEDKGIKLFWLDLLCKFLNVVSVGLLIPFTFCLKMRYINRNTVINRKKLIFTGAGFNLLGKYILWALLTCVTFGIYGWWIQLNFLKWQSSKIHIKKVGEEEVKEKVNAKAFIVVIGVFVAGIIILILILFILSRIFGGFTFSSFTSGYPIDDTINGWKYCEKGYAYKKANGYLEAECYKIDKNMSYNECLEAGGYINWNNYCYLSKKPLKESKQFPEAIEEGKIRAIVNGEEVQESSTCPSGWYYNDYYGKCAKDLEHVTYQECEAKGGDFAGYDSCTIYEN
jgi:uncharacterized membrane protein YjgN (DUF898 family)